MDVDDEESAKKRGTICKMQIRGIRSFSPKGDENIEFYSPLTMIVGQNGCGKTTIIECLKYVTTGALPPGGAKSGQSFINDPGMTESTEVKAHIKLRYVSASGIDSVTSRSMSLIKKKTKLEFKSLDGTMKTINQQGERVSTNMKCSELDRCVSESLGVTPAILENVIFCHQEDSSWPMQEGITLKKKLDDIFESTRYTKALEAFLKSKKEFAAKAKDLKSAQTELAAHMSAADLYLKELSDCQDNEDQCKEKLQGYEEQLEKLESKSTRFRENLTRLESSREEVNKMQLKIDDLTRRIRDRAQSLEKEYLEPDAQLIALLEDFDNKMKSKEKERRDLQRNIDAINHANSELRRVGDELNVKRGVSESLQQHLQSISSKFSDTIRKVCQKYSVQVPVVFDTESKAFKHAQAKDFLNKLNSKITEMQIETDQVAGQLRQQVVDQEKVVAETRASSQRQEIELENRNREISKLTQEISNRQNGLSMLTVSKDNLASLERDYETDKAQLEALSANQQVKSDEYKRKLRETSDKIRDLSDDYNRDADVLSSLSIRRGEILQNEAASRQVYVDEEQIKADLSVLFRNNSEALENAIVPDGPEDLVAVLDRLERRGQDKRRDLDKKKKDAEDLIRKSATADALLGDLKKKAGDERQKLYSLRTVEQDLKDLNIKVKSLVMDDFNKPPQNVVNGVANIDAPTVDGIRTALTYCTRELSLLDACVGAEKKGRRRVDKLKQNAIKSLQEGGDLAAQSACPCCWQPVTNAAADQRIDENLGYLLSYAGTAPETKERIEMLTEEYKATLSQLENPLRDLFQSKANLKEFDARIAEIEGTQGGDGVMSMKLKDDVHTLESFISSCEKAFSTLQELKIRWAGIHSRKGDCEAKKRSFQNSQFGADTGGRSIETIEQQQGERMKQKETLQIDKDRLMKEEAEHTKKFYVLNAATAEKEKALNDARKKGEKHTAEKKAIDELQRQLTEAQQMKRDIQSERDATVRDSSSRQSDLTEKKNRYEDAQQMNRTKMDEVRMARDQVQQLAEAVAETTAKLSSGDLGDVVVRIENTMAEIAKNTQQIDQINPRIQDINAELLNQEHTKRTVRENLELRHFKSDLEETKAALTKLRESKGLDEGKFNELARDLQRAEQEKSQVSNNMSAERGKLSIHEQQLRDIRTKLNGANYKDVKQKHRRKSIEYETTEMAVRDLDSYYNALDKALQNFHTLKIREINKIVRELWQLIYKGQDIDMIRLESGEEEGAAATAKATRSYNYRVVMCKGDTPLDMRGRCSAGQRVLASIVIRLALAETFCLSCGILALDEPTTNLDEQNKSGLAHALARIILSRSKQQNFQLIIITHDEDFVKLMSNELGTNAEFSLPEYYFRISREESEDIPGKFFSHIERLTWQNL